MTRTDRWMLLALVEAPLLALLAAALGHQGAQTVAAELAFIEAQGGRWMFANFLWILASAFWIVAATGVYGLVAPRRPRFGASAWLVTIVGSVFHAAIVAYAMVQAALVDSALAPQDVETFAEVVLFSHPAFLWVLLPFVLFYVGIILLALVLWRAQAAPGWVPAMTIVALCLGILLPVPFATELSFALLLATFATTVLRVRREPDGHVARVTPPMD